MATEARRTWTALVADCSRAGLPSPRLVPGIFREGSFNIEIGGRTFGGEYIQEAIRRATGYVLGYDDGWKARLRGEEEAKANVEEKKIDICPVCWARNSVLLVEGGRDQHFKVKTGKES